MSKLINRYMFCNCGHPLNDHLDTKECVRCRCVRFIDATTEHTARLTDFGLDALNHGKCVFKEQGAFLPFFIFENPDESRELIVLPEPLIDAITSVPRIKRMVFAAMRETVRRLGVRMAVFVTDCWCGRPTAHGEQLGPDGFHDAVKTFDQAEADGLVNREPAIMATIQTPERMMVMIQFYARDDQEQRVTWGEQFQMESDIDSLEGTTKLFGKTEVAQ